MNYIFDIADAVRSISPGKEFTIYGTDYNGLVWHDSGMPPTKEEVDAELIRLQAEYDAKLYQRQRAPEYPPLEDLADALYWQSKGDVSKLTAYLAACEAVKQKYPRGE